MSWFSSDPLVPGTPAPDFALRDEHGATVKLSALRGKNVVLVFYPGDNTPVCRAQLCEFRDRWQDAKKRNTVVFGVNPADEQSHESFQQKNHLRFPLLVDAGRKVAGEYKAGGLWVTRTVYLIGPDGVIRYAKRGKPAVSEVLAAAL
jgi:peroxiredoxin Q/BCP